MGEEQLIYRREVIALLFSVAAIADSLDKLYRLLGGDDEEEPDE